MSIAVLLDRAQALRREEVLDRKHDRPSVPFVPEVRKGWLDLEAEIATEFGALGVDWDDFAAAEARVRAEFAERWKEWHRLMRVCGRCIWCGKPRGTDGTTSFCRAHAESRNAYQRAWARAHPASVNASKTRLARKLVTECLCVDCTQERAVLGRRRCPPCAAKRATASKARKANQYAKGLCRNCNQPRLPGKVRCAAHTVKEAQGHLARKSARAA